MFGGVFWYPRKCTELITVGHVRLINGTRLRMRLTFSYYPHSCQDDHTMVPAGIMTVKFVGLPFPLEEALQHLSQLRRWGLTFSASFFLRATLSAQI